MTEEVDTDSGEIKITDLAEKWSVSEQYVTKMVRDGRIKKTRRAHVDAASADSFWATRNPAAVNARQTTLIQGGQASLPGKRPREGMGKRLPDGITKAALSDAKSAAVVARLGDTFAEQDQIMRSARVREVEAKAKRHELELKKMAGDLVSLADVEHAATNVGRLFAARMKVLPQRLGPQLAAITDPVECVRVIQDEANLLMDELRDAIEKSKM